MNVLWWALTILLVVGAAAAAISLVLGIAYLIVFSIVAYIEAKLGTIIIGEDEEQLIAQAEKLREEQRVAFKGPWTLEARVKPYDSKALRLSMAKEILGKKSTDKS